MYNAHAVQILKIHSLTLAVTTIDLLIIIFNDVFVSKLPSISLCLFIVGSIYCTLYVCMVESVTIFGTGTKGRVSDNSYME